MSKWLASCLLGSRYYDTDYILKLDKSHETVCKECNQNYVKLRKDELRLLSNSLDDMTLELQKRITHAENFSTELYLF